MSKWQESFMDWFMWMLCWPVTEDDIDWWRITAMALLLLPKMFIVAPLMLITTYCAICDITNPWGKE